MSDQADDHCACCADPAECCMDEPSRMQDVVPTQPSDAEKRPTMQAATHEYDIRVTGGEGETIDDIKDVFARQLEYVVDSVDGEDIEPTFE